MRFELIKTSVFVYRVFSKLAAPVEIGWHDIMTFILVYIIQISSRWPPGGVQVSVQVKSDLEKRQFSYD